MMLFMDFPMWAEPNITLFTLTIYLGTLVLDITTTVITDGEMKVSTGGQERQQVSGSLH